MKKFVSAAIVSAMLASMGVTAMAADVSFGSGATTDVAWPTNFGFGEKLTVIDTDSNVNEYVKGDKISLKPGDVIYMPLTHTILQEETHQENQDENNNPETEGNANENENVNNAPENSETDENENISVAAQVEKTVAYDGKIDKDWRIKFSAANYVDNAAFYTATEKDTNLQTGAVYIKVEMDTQLNSVETEKLSYGVYINETGTSNKTARVSVAADFANYYAGEVDFDAINFVNSASVWEVKAEKPGNAVFDFADEAYFDVNMYDGEKVLLDLSRDYVRDIVIANEDADLEFYNFRGTHDKFIRQGTLSIYGEEDSYVYEIINDKLYDVDFKYNKDEDTIEIKTDTLGHYVVSDMELEYEAVKPSTPSTPSKPSTDSNSNSTTDKENPSTGAGNFVEAAAAMAVVSVAGAGALAGKLFSAKNKDEE